MKAYTDLEQSKKLAEFLSLESADMHYHYDYDFDELESIPTITEEDDHFVLFSKDVRCWSLAALLEQLKSEIILENKQILFLHLNKYDDTDYEIRYTNSWSGEVLIKEADNLIDACYEMILKLNELKLWK